MLRPPSRHRWLDCADKVSQWVRSTGKAKPVKVALIDNGVDASHDRLRENIKGGVTYNTRYPGKDRVTSSYYASTDGHGTLMATLIRTVCPAVELYIAKLDDSKASEGSSFTAESAAEVSLLTTTSSQDLCTNTLPLHRPYTGPSAWTLT